MLGINGMKKCKTIKLKRRNAGRAGINVEVDS